MANHWREISPHNNVELPMDNWHNLLQIVVPNVFDPNPHMNDFKKELEKVIDVYSQNKGGARAEELN